MKKSKLLMLTVGVLMLLLAFSATCYGASGGYEINADNSANGYIKIKSLAPNNKALKVTIEHGATKYTYDLNGKGNYETFPLQMGNGSYKVKVLENVSDSKYSVKQTADLEVTLTSSNAPFLASNQYVNFTSNSAVVKKAAELVQGKNTEMEKVEAIYDYVISNISYDTAKATTVKSGYLPSVDDTLLTKKGICFDYASMMAAMLRSQSIPAKLVTGYSTQLSTFHAWNEIYTKETGWITVNKMYFDGNSWQLMDSTIASSAKQSGDPKNMNYVSSLIDGKNYTKKCEY